MKQFECMQTDVSEQWDDRELRAVLPRQFAKGEGKHDRSQGQMNRQMKAVVGFLKPKVVPSRQQLGLNETDWKHWPPLAAKWNNETAHLCPAGVARGE